MNVYYTKPNAIIFRESPDLLGCVVRLEDCKWKEGYLPIAYKKTTDPLNLDPIVNWMEFPSDREYVHPANITNDDNKARVVAIDTYHIITVDGIPVKLTELASSGNVWNFFNKVLDSYNSPN